MSDILIQELSNSDCSHCAAAKEVLGKEIKPAYPDVKIEHIEMMTSEGQELVQKHGIMSSPGILVNGELFSMGGLDKKKLVEKIETLRS